jgi:trimeric autotransporter adhesin
MPLSLDGTTGISATGNIVGNNINANTLSVTTFAPASLSAAGNVTGGNVLTAGIMSSTGNGIHGNVLTGGQISATGAITTAANISLTGNIIDSSELWINTLANGNLNLNPNGTGQTNIPTGILSVTGNIQGGNLRTAGLVSATGAVTGSQFNGSGAGLTSIPNGALSNSSVTLGSTALTLGSTVTTVAGLSSVTSTTFVGSLSGAATTAGTVTTAAQGNITSVGTLTGLTINNATTAITNGATSGSGNIGASGATFNIIFARATSAQYADLAENYEADKMLDAGQVVEFGGEKEIQQTTTSHSTKIAGVISTRPSYLMNAELTGELVYPVALTGRVPCYVVGNIKKGDLLVSSDIRAVATVMDPLQYQPGCIVGKALEDYDNQEIGRIEIAVGRF